MPDDIRPPARALAELAEGTAAIAPVTEAALDQAARAAAALADAAAHETHAGRADDAQPEAAPGRPAGGAVERYGARLVEIAAANAAAASRYWAALIGATSLTEAAAINADHMGRTLDAAASQGRELALLAQKATLDAFRPSKRRD